MDRQIDALPPQERLRCRNPIIMKDAGKQIEFYPHMDYDERIPPTEEEARLMCTTSGKMCPVAEQCLKLGLSIEAPCGVWGGEVLVDGEVYNQGGTHGSSNR